MGVYQYTDPQTQRSYNFNIAGDNPSNEDFVKIRQYLDGERADYGQKYQSVFGEEFESDDETAVRGGLRRGYQQIKSAIGETVGTAGEQAGLGFLAQYGQDTEEKARQRLGELLLEQPERLQSTDVDSFGDAFTFAGQVVGEQIPQLGLGLGAAALAPAVAGATGLAGFGVGVAAAAGATAPILFGNNIQRQEDEVAAGRKTSVDVGAALTATFGQATLEGLADKILLGGVLRPLGKSIFTRTASRAGGGATTEGLTEVGQQVMERAQAGLAIDSDDAIAEYREAAIAGGLIGGGTRATFGAFQGVPETEAERKARLKAEKKAALDAKKKAALDAKKKAALEVETDTDTGAVEPTVDTTTSAQQTEATPAQQTEARNAANPAPPEGKAQETNEAQAAAAAEIDTSTNQQAAVTREAENADGKAAAKTDEYLKKQSVFSASEVEATIATDPRLTDPNLDEDFLRQELDTEYSPELIEAIIAKKRVGKNLAAAAKSEQTGENIQVDSKPSPEIISEENKVTKEFLVEELGVQPYAHIVRGAKRSIVGLSFDDPKVREELELYVKNGGSSPKVKEYLDKLKGIDAEPIAEEAGVSIPSSRTGLDGSTGAQSGIDSAETPVEPNNKRVGTDLLPSGRTTDPAGEQPSALKKDSEALAAERARIAADPKLYAQKIRDAKEESGYDTPAEVLVEPEELDKRKAILAGGQPKPLKVPAPKTGIGGTVTGAAEQVIPAPVQVSAAPLIQAAPVPQEQLQAVEAERDAVAQARIERTFENNRGKQPQVREYHDTQVDPRSAPEVTTAVDKEGVAELLETPDKDLDTRAKAAKLFFKRFRRPVDALAEMGAVSAAGPAQSIEKDYTPVEFAFYKGMTQKSAMDARRWVFNNLSRQAFVETRDASVLARRDTSKFNPSDAVIAVTKAAKSIKRKDDRAFQKQMDRELDALKLEAQTRAPAAPDQEMRAEGAVGATKLIKGQTTFDSYLLGLGFKKRKVPKQDDYVFIDPNTKKALTDEELMDLYDSFAYTESELGFLLVDPVHGLDQALLPSIRNALQRGDLGFALNAIASTNQVEDVRRIAAAFANVVGDTQVQVVDDLSQVVGRTAAGLFSPETNTIQIDANRGMNVHTILHEMSHAATSAAIANPSLPETKQLQALLNAAREQFGEVYGTKNLDEFVAESQGNPEFRSALTLLRVDGGKRSGIEKYYDAVMRVIRKVLRLSPSPSALTEIDRVIQGMLAPSPATRAAPDILLEAGTKEGSSRLLQSMSNFDVKDKVLDASDVMFNEGVAKTAKSWYLNVLPVNILTEKAQDKIPFAKELNTIINRMSGRLREKTEILGSMTYDLKQWQRKNKNHARTLNNIIPRSTYLKVDPSRTDKKYTATFKDDKQRMAEYKQLRKQYLSMDKKGQELYRQLRNYFQDTYDDIIAALDARLAATIPDAAVRKTAFARLRELLEKDSGVIRPYFPLQRKGNYRLVYTAPDPDTGQPELYVEYYPTLRKAQQARDMVSKVGGTDVEVTEASRAMNFERAPSTSFVRNVLETVQLQRENFNSDEDYKQAMQQLVDLALDAMPERSFMQNFRRRKGIRGFIGDTTPTGILGQEFDAYTMLKEKGRDLNRQLVQLRSAAEIENFRKKLADPEAGYLTNPETAMTAQKLDKIATFAQSPNVPRWSQVATSLGFGMTMGLNLSSAVITFFDVAMSAMPILAGKHGIRATTAAYGDAMRALMNAPTTRIVMVTGPDGQPVEQEINMGVQGKTIANYTPQQLLERFGKDVRMDILVESGLDQAQFNQSITQENLDIGRDAPLESVNRISSFMFHHSERINREATLQASYLLEVKKLLKKNKNPTDADYKQAAQNAIDDTEFTLGATAAAGRPIVAQSGIGNVLFLFKRFAISKYYMMERLAKESIKTTNVDKIMADEGVSLQKAQDIADSRKAARAGSRNFLVMTGLLSGLGGMPLMGTFGAIYNLFRDDDEDDFEAATRKVVGEGIYGGLANEILGVDVANRVSMNSLLYRAPIIDKDQDALWTLAEQLGGPVLGTYLSMSRGVKDVASGEVRRGLEAMAPSALRNFSKAERFAREGATTRRGDPITEDINPYNIVMQAAGFAPQAYIQQLEFNKNNRRRQETINSRRSKLLRQRNMAYREGDFEEVRRVDEKIARFNSGLPEGARKSLITGDTKRRSLGSFGRTTEKMRGGMTYTPFMEQSLKEFDQGLQLY